MPCSRIIIKVGQSNNISNRRAVSLLASIHLIGIKTNLVMRCPLLIDLFRLSLKMATYLTCSDNWKNRSSGRLSKTTRGRSRLSCRSRSESNSPVWRKKCWTILSAASFKWWISWRGPLRSKKAGVRYCCRAWIWRQKIVPVRQNRNRWKQKVIGKDWFTGYLVVKTMNRLE